MTNNSEGLSPTLRPQLGVGWNRALPAPFGFDNGIYPDGVNDYLVIPGFEGKRILDMLPLTMEFWFTGALPTNYGVFRIFFSDTAIIFRQFVQSGGGYVTADGSVANNTNISLQTFSPRAKYVITIENTMVSGYRNTQSFAITATPGLFNDNYEISKFQLLTENGTSRFFKNPIDEFRIYQRGFTREENILNWNDGTGNNPAKTEGLIVYYKFEEFENLDFSLLQDNSDIRLGIRDLSGNNNHAQPINMDTDPLSPYYVLKPF